MSAHDLDMSDRDTEKRVTLKVKMKTSFLSTKAFVLGKPISHACCDGSACRGNCPNPDPGESKSPLWCIYVLSMTAFKYFAGFGKIYTIKLWNQSGLTKRFLAT